MAGSGPLADAEQDTLPGAGWRRGARPAGPIRWRAPRWALGAGLAGVALWWGWGLGAGFRACRARYSARLCEAGRALAAFPAFPVWAG